ncbi:MAG: hypothetical protein MZU91_12220 [Desulfosudis oleivorans]|nr:hypothetical protein [Desulfosudis oleivorans]
MKTIFRQDDLERRAAIGHAAPRPWRRSPIDRRIVERDYQIDCIDTLCREIAAGPPQAAGGDGHRHRQDPHRRRAHQAPVRGQRGDARAVPASTASRWPSRPRTPLPSTCPTTPAYVLRAGRRFQDEKRITITTLQSMVNLYAEYSAAAISTWSSATSAIAASTASGAACCAHFDGIQLGLTATPLRADPRRRRPPTTKTRPSCATRCASSKSMRPRSRTSSRTPSATATSCRTRSTRRRPSRPPPKAASRSSAASWTGRPWTPKPAPNSNSCSATSRPRSRSTPSALERRFTVPERNRAIVREYAPGAGPGLHRRQGRAAQAAAGQDHRLRRQQAARRDAGPAVRRAVRAPQALARGALCRLRRQRAGRRRHRRWRSRRHDQDPPLQEGEVPADPGLGEHARHRLRLPGGRQPRLRALHAQSAILYQQMRGRGTRKARNKPVFTMFDFVGVADYHGDDDDYAEGGVVLARQARKKYQPRRLLALDVDDHIDPTTREWVTIDENGNMVFPGGLGAARRRAGHALRGLDPEPARPGPRRRVAGCA